MEGYKVVYREPDGTVTYTFFGEPITNVRIPRSSYIDIVEQLFCLVYPDCEIIFIERCVLG